MNPETYKNTRKELNSKIPLERLIKIFLSDPTLNSFSQLVTYTGIYNTDEHRFRVCELLQLLPESIYDSIDDDIIYYKDQCQKLRLKYCRTCPLYNRATDNTYPNVCNFFYSKQIFGHVRATDITLEQYWEKNKERIITAMRELMIMLNTVDMWREKETEKVKENIPVDVNGTLTKKLREAKNILEIAKVIIREMDEYEYDIMLKGELVEMKSCLSEDNIEIECLELRGKDGKLRVEITDDDYQKYLNDMYVVKRRK